MRLNILLIFFIILALSAGFLISQFSPFMVICVALGMAIFTLSFINADWGLYILIFSMLLSPEIIVGDTAGGSLQRGITLRFEDFLLALIGFSWFAKNAVNKELGLFLKTPLNKPIYIYTLACLISTGVGIIEGVVDAKTGPLFVLKYIEYFIVYFMVVNHVKSRDQIKKFVFCLLLTCFITSIIGILQIPSGERVSAPFEGEIGEPNTFVYRCCNVWPITKVKKRSYKAIVRHSDYRNHTRFSFYPIPRFLFGSNRNLFCYRNGDAASHHCYRFFHSSTRTKSTVSSPGGEGSSSPYIYPTRGIGAVPDWGYSPGHINLCQNSES